jgi:hypothetical protein
MKQFLLAAVLIAVPVAAFTAFNVFTAQASAPAASLGDLSPMRTIIADVQKIAASGDFTGAERRVTDFESAWDDAQPSMRPLNPDAWGNIDQAADTAFTALRSGSPQADKVDAALVTLLATLNDPVGGTTTATGSVTLVSGIAVSDAKGRALPCEDMIKAVSGSPAAAKLSGADKSTVEDLKAKALERCNADDDQHANQFSAQALALLAK